MPIPFRFDFKYYTLNSLGRRRTATLAPRLVSNPVAPAPPSLASASSSTENKRKS